MGTTSYKFPRSGIRKKKKTMWRRKAQGSRKQAAAPTAERLGLDCTLLTFPKSFTIGNPVEREEQNPSENNSCWWYQKRSISFALNFLRPDEVREALRTSHHIKSSHMGKKELLCLYICLECLYTVVCLPWLLWSSSFSFLKSSRYDKLFALFIVLQMFLGLKCNC